MRKLKKIQHQHLYIRVLDINSWSKTEAAQMNLQMGTDHFSAFFTVTKSSSEILFLGVVLYCI